MAIPVLTVSQAWAVPGVATVIRVLGLIVIGVMGLHSASRVSS